MMAITASATVKAIRRNPVGEILWLAVTLVESAVIMGIVCLPLSADLLPRSATGAASGDRIVTVVAATSAAADAAPSPTYQVNRLPLPEASLPSMDLATEELSVDVPTLALGAQPESSGVLPSPHDTGAPAPAARRPQQARSHSATRKKAASTSPAAPSLRPPAPSLTPPAPTLTPPKVIDQGW